MVSGTAPIGDDGGCVAEGDPHAQTLRCLELIDRAVAALADGSPATVVRTRVFLTRADDWNEVGRAHGQRFASTRPVTAFVVVAALLDPRWLLEIEAEAIVGVVPAL